MNADSSFIPLHRFREHGSYFAPFRTDIPLATAETLTGAFCAFPKPPPPGAGQRDLWPMVRTLAMERHLLRLSLSS